VTEPRLPATHLAPYRRDDLLVLRRLFQSRGVAQIRAWTDEVPSHPEVPGAGYMVYGETSLTKPGRRLISRSENSYPHHAGFRALFDGGKLLDAVSQLLGEPAVPFKDKINFNTAGGDGFRPHQERQPGWSVYARLLVTALVSIDEATPENGCLELAAGHHRRGLIGEEWKPLTEAHLSGAAFAAHPTSPGDVVFFDASVPTSRGRTARRRPAASST
jgi:hypothetical protein